MRTARQAMRRVLAAGLIATGTTAADPVSATTACGERARLLDWLARAYDETPAAVALTSGGELIELLRTTDGATWTLLVTSTSGRTCVLAVGEGWRRAHDGVERDSPT